MARSLAQALEGISFPCDRSKLIDYARTNNAVPKAIESLSAIPQRQYRDMTEVLAALPSKQQMRRRTVVGNQQSEEQQPQTESAPEPRREPPAPMPVAAQDEPRLAEAFWWAPIQNDGANWWSMGLNWTSNYVRWWQQFWFPWMR